MAEEEIALEERPAGCLDRAPLPDETKPGTKRKADDGKKLREGSIRVMEERRRGVMKADDTEEGRQLSFTGVCAPSFTCEDVENLIQQAQESAAAVQGSTRANQLEGSQSWRAQVQEVVADFFSASCGGNRKVVDVGSVVWKILKLLGMICIADPCPLVVKDLCILCRPWISKMTQPTVTSFSNLWWRA